MPPSLENGSTALKIALYQASTIYFQGKMKEDPLRDSNRGPPEFFQQLS